MSNVYTIYVPASNTDLLVVVWNILDSENYNARIVVESHSDNGVDRLLCSNEAERAVHHDQVTVFEAVLSLMGLRTWEFGESVWESVA